MSEENEIKKADSEPESKKPDIDELSVRAEKAVKIVKIVAMCLIPLGLLYACTIGDCIKCTSCGDDNNRLVFYASGIENGVQYKSCVGPGGILGCGINCKWWPTECVSIKKSEGSSTVTGCVTYYNGFGCIDRTEVMSDGSYSTKTNIGCITCKGDLYQETVRETTQGATRKSSLIGCYSCEKTPVDRPKGYNSEMPRSFTYGCWTNK